MTEHLGFYCHVFCERPCATSGFVLGAQTLERVPFHSTRSDCPWGWALTALGREYWGDARVAEGFGVMHVGSG